MKVCKGEHAQGLSIPTPDGFLPAKFDKVIMDARWCSNSYEEFNVEATMPTGEIYLLSSIDLDFLD